MPDLKWQDSQLTIVEDKARALYERFYLVTEADLGDITDIEF
jgi:hypothetical protein